MPRVARRADGEASYSHLIFQGRGAYGGYIVQFVATCKDNYKHLVKKLINRTDNIKLQKYDYT